MSYTQIEIFLYVADCGSFNKASEKLYISATAIMKQMNLLEEHLGIQLLHRTNHGISLTSAGESIYKDAKVIISYWERAVQKAHKLLESEKYIIRVGTSMLNPCKVFINLWSKVNDKFPKFKIKIIPFEDNNSNILSVISEIGNKFDFLVAACNSKQWLKLCNFYKLGEYKICCAIPYKHRLAQTKLLEINDLYGERLLMVKRGDSLINDCIRDEIEKNHSQILIEDTNNFYDISVFNYCEQTNSILLTLDEWADIHPSLVTVPVNWNYTIPYGLLYSLSPSKNIIQFLKLVQDIIK